jgi:hypothetical protein
MKFGRLHRFALMATAGAMVFQTTASCTDQALNSFAASVMPGLTSALTTAVTNAVQGDSTTSTPVDSTCPQGGGAFGAVCGDIQGVNSGLLQATPPQSDTSTTTTQ